jgi:hypothetical protein
MKWIDWLRQEWRERKGEEGDRDRDESEREKWVIECFSLPFFFFFYRNSINKPQYKKLKTFIAGANPSHFYEVFFVYSKFFKTKPTKE